MRERDWRNVGMALTLVAVASSCEVSVNPVERPEAGPTPVIETMPLLFTEALEQNLKGWVTNQDYDHEFLEPLANYSKNLYETSSSPGWIEIENESSIEVWVGESNSPELLQNSGAVFFKVNDELRGFIWNDYGTYSLQGTGEEIVKGTLTHFSGGVVGDYKCSFEAQIPYEGPIPFLIVWRSENKFRGWAGFRCDQRALCGVANGADYPRVCKWR